MTGEVWTFRMTGKHNQAEGRVRGIWCQLKLSSRVVEDSSLFLGRFLGVVGRLDVEVRFRAVAVGVSNETVRAMAS